MGNQPKPMKEGISSSLSIDTLDDIARAAKMIYQSGAFGNLNNSQEAGSKIMAGLELGLSPMTAVRNIYFFDGSVTLSGPIIAALIREHPDYDYRILGANSKGAKVRFFRRETGGGEAKMAAQEPDVAFTEKMAEKAGLLSKQNWKQFPEDMYVWRCVARGSRWHCPEVGKGTLYLPDEIKHGATPHEPTDQIQADEGEPVGGEPEVEGKPKQVPDEEKPSSTGAEEAPDKQVKPLETPDNGERRTPAKPTAEATAPANTGKVAGRGQGTNESGQGEKDGRTAEGNPSEDHLRDAVPAAVSVNPAALTEKATKMAISMDLHLEGMDAGNRLLTKIKEYRDDVRDTFPNEEDADRVALDDILDHHIERIGGGSGNGNGGLPSTDATPEGTPSEDPSGDPDEKDGKPSEAEAEAEAKKDGKPSEAEEGSAEGEPSEEIPGLEEGPPMPWHEEIGTKFRADMEKTRGVLREAAAKGGVSPLEARLEEVWERFRSANPTEDHLRAFESTVNPWEAILAMRKALIGGDPSEEAFNQAVAELYDATKNFTNERRRKVSLEIVNGEVKRMAAEFDSLNVDWDTVPPQASLETGETAETAVPDMPLPPGFPKKETLENEGVTRTGQVAERLRDGNLTSVPGIGDAFAERIADYLRQITDGGATEKIGF